jgi:hypothetical protein
MIGGRERIPLSFKIKMKNNLMTSEQITAMIAENIQLKEDNSNLIKEQKEFQYALIEKINAIKDLGPWRRFWGYWRLVMDLITTIEQAISKSK